MFFKIMVIGLLILIFISLMSGLFFLLKDPGNSKSNRVVTSLSFRVGLSILLFVFLIVSYYMGWLPQ